MTFISFSFSIVGSYESLADNVRELTVASNCENQIEIAPSLRRRASSLDICGLDSTRSDNETNVSTDEDDDDTVCEETAGVLQEENVNSETEKALISTEETAVRQCDGNEDVANDKTVVNSQEVTAEDPDVPQEMMETIKEEMDTNAGSPIETTSEGDVQKADLPPEDEDVMPEEGEEPVVEQAVGVNGLCELQKAVLPPEETEEKPVVDEVIYLDFNGDMVTVVLPPDDTYVSPKEGKPVTSKVRTNCRMI